MAKQKYIKASGIIYSSELNTIHKSGNKLQPIYEAFTNACAGQGTGQCTRFLITDDR